jgi:RNA polymerase sigma factor (sigma-70 family)
MERDHGPPAEGAASFHTTRWTIVMKAAQSRAQGGPSALAELCRLYWYPLYIFARRRGNSPDDAQDLTQAFFLHLLEHRAFANVDRLKGKFRSFLLASFQNHLSDQIDRTRRLKRGGYKEFVQLDAEEAEERYRLEPVEFLTPEKIFDARWAMTVLEEALKKLSQEYAVGGKASTFEALKVSWTLTTAEICPRTTKWRIGFKSPPARSKHLSIGYESGTPHCCERRSAARYLIRPKLTKRFTLYATLW